jgi:hypothetical protein
MIPSSLLLYCGFRWPAAVYHRRRLSPSPFITAAVYHHRRLSPPPFITAAARRMIGEPKTIFAVHKEHK